MPPELPAPGSPQDWMRFAYSDLALARSPLLPGVLLEGLCYHAQQAAEKALKAVLVFLNIDFPRTHNIRTLLDLLPAEIPIIERSHCGCKLDWLCRFEPLPRIS